LHERERFGFDFGSALRKNPSTVASKILRARSPGVKGQTMDEFDRYRAEMNEKLLSSDHLGIKRFFALDTQAYEDGALDKRTKEMLGLVASIVLRCDDCITYHIKQSASAGVKREEFLEVFNVALVVGGSITIPHLRRAIDRLDQVLTGSNTTSSTPHSHN
jgi:AhpD family alkylhydroperoxidase